MAPLISDEYRKQNAELHAKRKDYGAGGSRWAQSVEYLAGEHACTDILDYGCGKGSLKAALQRRGVSHVFEYDPAVPEKLHKRPCDLVVCADVLEHVEPDMLDDVLFDLRQLARKAVFVVIALGPSDKTLPDGRNAHLIQESADWWRKKLSNVFSSIETQVGRGLDRELVALCLP